MVSLRAPILLCLSAAAAYAQSTHGYVFAAAGAVTASNQSVGILHGAAGVEVRLPVGLAVGGELGAITNLDRRGVVVLGSLNGSYHFDHHRHNKVDPFVTAGYTGLISDGSLSAFNFGGGVNWWFLRHTGLKLEFRDHITQTGFSFLSTGGSTTIQMPEFRVGIAFR